MAAAAEAPPAGAARGAVWLLADMSLNVWALAIVKAAGTEVTAVQLVFLRALVGLLVMAPWILLARRENPQQDAARDALQPDHGVSLQAWRKPSTSCMS